MSGESRKRKRKNRFHRWLAMALTVAMLAGQGKVDVWAQEGADDVPPAAESSEEIKTDAVEDSGAEDNNSDPDQDDENNGGSGDQDTEDDNSPAKGEEPEEGKNTEENGDTENHNPEDVGQENADGQDVCVCETRCTEDAVNADCPVCAADYAACAGKDADDTEKNDTENHDPEGDGQENADGIGKEMEEILPETVSGNTLDGEADIAVLADEGVEAYAVGDMLTYNGITYIVTGGSEVEVGRQGVDAVSGDIVIPASFGMDGVTYRVTSISVEAFDGCSGLTSVEIPNSVTSIGIGAFYECGSLSSIKLPDSVTKIEISTFSHCTNLSSVEIPDSVTSIGNYAFRKCSSLSSIEIPDSVISIGTDAFLECSNLSSVEIPDSVTSIGNGAFHGCSGLTSVEIPDSVTSIGGGAFEGCSSLTSVEISNSVTSIEEQVFNGCLGLVNVKIPDSVTSIGSGAFRGCSSLSSIELPKNVTSIGDDAFRDCIGLNSVELPDGVTRIGIAAFCNCSSLSNVELPDSVTSIGGGAFSSCSRLSNVELPDGVTSLEIQIFYGCSSLSSIEIPDSVTSIGRGAFDRCSSLSSVKIPDGVTSIESCTFEYCSNLSRVEIPDGVTSIGRSAFERCSSLSSIEIPDSVTSIDHLAFYNCSSFTSVEIPDSVTSMGILTFAYCSNLRSVKISNSLTSIEDSAFYCCDSLSSVELPDSVTSIEEYAFGNAHNLTSATISENITKIGNFGFYMCFKLEELRIVVSSGGKFQFPEIGTDAFAGNPSERYILFVDETGKELTGGAFEAAKDTFVEAAKTDGSDDGKWYGWSLKGLQEIKDTYKVTINAQKDNVSWADHNRTFALTKDSGATFVANLDAVEAGTYTVYDVTGVSVNAFQIEGVNTGATVTVSDADVSADVDYYTVTFYDGTAPYGTGQQQPQTVLNGQRAAKPEAPSKTEWQFAGWKTEDGGSAPYDFESAITNTTSIFASWIERTEDQEQLCIVASATDGGIISPSGVTVVTKGGEQSFIIMPNEGNRIKAVTVDGSDVTAELADTLARARTGSKYYTFMNVTEDHTIHASFESDGSNPGAGDAENPNPGGGGDNGNPGGSSGNSGGGTHAGSGSGSGGGFDNTNLDSGAGTENIQVTLVSETTAALTENSAADSTGTTPISGGQEAGTGAAGTSVSKDGADVTEERTNAAEPETGDTTHIEIYATVAMIAGLTYLLLYFTEEGRGMTEREKEVFVAAFIRWGKKGGAFRRGCAVVAIFCLLVYYHSIGKCADKNVLSGKYLGQVS